MPDTQAATQANQDDQALHERKAGAALLLGALGIVYGDIGTSPIYTLRESFKAAGISEMTDPAAAQAAALGVLSMVIWTVLIIVTFKYVVLVMRADNDGEGGIIALISQALRGMAEGRVHTGLLLGVFGASLFYGDGIITPAISVLSAIERLDVATPFFHPYIVPITLVILSAAATVIASQAVISGAFSLTQQAMQLWLLPRLDLRQTSEESAGQVYVPQVNWMLMIAVVGLVLSFRSSDALAAAYGIAVTGTMLVTTWRMGRKLVLDHTGDDNVNLVPYLQRAHKDTLGVDPDTASFFTGRELPISAFEPAIPLWHERLFSAMTSNAVSAARYFLIPSERVIELGTQVEL